MDGIETKIPHRFGIYTLPDPSDEAWESFEGRGGHWSLRCGNTVIQVFRGAIVVGPDRFENGDAKAFFREIQAADEARKRAAKEAASQRAKADVDAWLAARSTKETA